MKAYLAAPLFNDIERAFNVRLAGALAPHIDIYLPQRDGFLLKKLVDSGVPIGKARLTVFNGDVAAIGEADVLIAVLDGRTVDEGVAFELGCAYALGKTCIGLKTDDRVMLPTGDNPMIACGCHKIFMSVADLVAAVEKPNALIDKLGSQVC